MIIMFRARKYGIIFETFFFCRISPIFEQQQQQQHQRIESKFSWLPIVIKKRNDKESMSA